MKAHIASSRNVPQRQPLPHPGHGLDHDFAASRFALDLEATANTVDVINYIDKAAE